MLDYNPPADLLRDKTILLTGAGGGLGAALAKACASHGATVILLGRTVRRLTLVYDAIEASGGPEPALYPMDLRGASEQDYADLNATVLREFGRLDGLVHCAALLGTLTPIAQFDLDVWSTVMHVNLTAPMLLSRALIPSLQASGCASVVFCSDAKTRAYWGAYGVAKAGLDGLVQILAHEWDDRAADAPQPPRANPRIRVNSVDPGPLRTGLRASAYPGELPSSLPAAETAAAQFLYLLGADSEGITGRCFRRGDDRAGAPPAH